MRIRLSNAAAVIVLASTALLSQNSNVSGPSQGNSVADAARANREKIRATVRMTAEDEKRLSDYVDRITDFVSQTTGYAKHGPVTRKVLSQEKFEQQLTERRTEEDEQKRQERLEQAEVVLKKFGLLPADFRLAKYTSSDALKAFAAYYRFSDKTVYLLNWIPLETQKHMMAHELTHALQDQNFDLTRFMSTRAATRQNPAMFLKDPGNSETLLARRAVLEGQASLIEAQYIFHAMGAPEEMQKHFVEYLRNNLENREQPVAVHAAPRILQELYMFPYREGALFELEVLHKAGAKAAFAGTLLRPPQSSYEVLEPDAYLAQKRAPSFSIPDLQPVLGTAYEPYDTGTMSEFEVQVMSQEFGRENDLYSVVPFWNDGGYIAVKKAGLKSEVTTGDLALLYVSDWKSREAARRFAQIYKAALSKRLKVIDQQVIEPDDCEGKKNCVSPNWAARVLTNEGPVFIEVWPGNKVFIAQSFDDKTVSKVRNLVLNPTATAKLIPLDGELGFRLYDHPAVAAAQQEIGAQLFRRALQETLAAAQ